MPMQSGLEIFERAVAARGRLLRIEADRTGSTPSTLVLTFDVGRIVLRPGEKGLRVDHARARSELPDGLVTLEEEEPWWRVLGQPITAAWPGGTERAVGASGPGPREVLKLRFREEDENPRIVRLEAAGAVIRVALE